MEKNKAHGMECKELFALLSRYIDADLPVETCAHIERHLQGCEPCVAFLNTLRRTAELCRQYQPGDLPRPLEDKVRHDLRAVYEAALTRKNS